MYLYYMNVNLEHSQVAYRPCLTSDRKESHAKYYKKTITYVAYYI